MVQWMKGLLYESTPSEFRSAYGVAESVERLRAATKRSAFSAMGDTAAVGKVTVEIVRLQRVIPMIHNSFKPFFTGRFETRDGVTVLTGHFGMSNFTKIFMTFWLAMVALFAVSFMVTTFNSASSMPPAVVAGPLLMLAAGVGFVALGKWFARNDAAWLSGVIGQALGQPVAGVMTPVTEVDATAVPGVLKGVALFLAAWSVMLIVMNFFGSRMMPAQPTNPAGVALGHWQLGYAVAALVLAAGVWRRRPWAWWGGFLLFGLAIVTSLLAMPVNVEPPTPPVIRVIFGIFAVIVAGVWGRWWYAQRRHFLWTSMEV